MTDKEFELQRKRLKKYIDKWQTPCGFDWWGITHAFTRERDEQYRDAAATTTTQWQYRNAYITWVMPEVADLTDDELDECVLHELCHILVAPLENYDPAMSDKTEFAVTNTQRAIKYAYEAGLSMKGRR